MPKPALDTVLLAHIKATEQTCEKLRERLHTLEDLYENGNFGIDRAFVKQIEIHMKDLRKPIEARMAARQKQSA